MPPLTPMQYHGLVCIYHKGGVFAGLKNDAVDLSLFGIESGRDATGCEVMLDFARQNPFASLRKQWIGINAPALESVESMTMLVLAPFYRYRSRDAKITEIYHTIGTIDKMRPPY
jgi:hypothetical protein